MQLDWLGRTLLVLGLVIAVVGLLIIFLGRVPGLGRLPGDIVWEWDNVSIYVPIMTSIVISIVLTVVLNVVAGLFHRQ